MTIRTYSEIRKLNTIKERFDYLALHGRVGDLTFGFDRYMNQMFYTSAEWKKVRLDVIARDNGCDLGIEGFEIYRYLTIHHMNPMTVHDIKHGIESILDPEFLITTVNVTHNEIHYGNGDRLPRNPVQRRRGDTKLW